MNVPGTLAVASNWAGPSGVPTAMFAGLTQAIFGAGRRPSDATNSRKTRDRLSPEASNPCQYARPTDVGGSPAIVTYSAVTKAWPVILLPVLEVAALKSAVSAFSLIPDANCSSA